MDEPKTPIELTEEEKKNRKFYRTMVNLNFFVMLIHIVIFYLLFTLISFIIDTENPSIGAIFYFISGYIIFLTAGWMLSMPIRYAMYCVCKKHGLMQQEFKPWFKDWSKLLLVNLLIYVPFLSVSTLVFYYNYNQGIVVLFILVTVFLLFFIGVQFIKKFVSMWFIHGLYLLNSGEKFTFWNNLAKDKNVKIYPIWILPISSKVKFNNAFALGFKNAGFILMTDCLLDNLTREQVSAILAHETAHLIKNDILKRFIGILIAAAGCYLIFSDLLNIDILLGLVLYLLLLLGAIIFLFSMARHQEYFADKFSFAIFGEAVYMIEALDYLYTSNKYPVSSKKSIFLKFLSLHPSLEDRKNRLLACKK